MKRSLIQASVVLTALLLTSGCERRTQVEFVPVTPPVEWHDLGQPDRTDLQNRHALLVHKPTTGLLPSSLAVARVQLCPLPDDAPAGQAVPETSDTIGTGRRLALHMQPEAELLPWNSVLDDQRQVSDVFPIKSIALQGESVTVKHLLETAAAMHANLCLVYASANLGATESEAKGILFDTRTQRPLAVLEARADVPDAETACAELPPEIAQDPRYHDAPGLTAYRFERLLRESVIAVRHNDQPLENQSPEGWRPAHPPDYLIVPQSDRYLGP